MYTGPTKANEWVSLVLSGRFSAMIASPLTRVDDAFYDYFLNRPDRTNETHSLAFVDPVCEEGPRRNMEGAVANDNDRVQAVYRFTVNNFTALEGPVFSPQFYVRGFPWKVKVTPRQPPQPARIDEKSLGIYAICNEDDESPTWSIYAMVESRLICHKPGAEPLARRLEHLFYLKENEWGFSHFLPWKDLMDPAKGYLHNDSITVEVLVVAEPPNNWDNDEPSAFGY